MWYIWNNESDRVLFSLPENVLLLLFYRTFCYAWYLESEYLCRSCRWKWILWSIHVCSFLLSMLSVTFKYVRGVIFYAYVYTRLCLCARVYAYVYSFMSMCACLCICVLVYVYVRMFIPMCTRLCLCAHVYAYVYSFMSMLITLCFVMYCSIVYCLILSLLCGKNNNAQICILCNILSRQRNFAVVLYTIVPFWLSWTKQSPFRILNQIKFVVVHS